ncbi:MAG: hypothetical protein LBT38_08770 [Deltaproteobacteria bacterium]|jgi:hypothetical protein|nr:hypothetical protein [Deltaproteobacteria bacterium]
MSIRNNETLDSPILEPLNSGVLATVSDAELLERLLGLGFHPVSPQTVDRKTAAKVEEKPVANTVQADNNKVLDAKIEVLESKINFFMVFLSFVALIFIVIAIPAHYSLSNKIDALIKKVSDMRVDIAKLQMIVWQNPVSEQRKPSAPAETK